MAMAQDQRVDLRGIDLQHFHVAVDGLGRPTVIEQESPLVVATLRLQQQRQSPFAVQRAQRIGGTAGLGLDPATSCGRKKISLALSTSTRTLSLSMVGTSIGPALAISMQAKPPAAAARPADSFKASRRLMFGMGFSPRSGCNQGALCHFSMTRNTGPIGHDVNLNTPGGVPAVNGSGLCRRPESRHLAVAPYRRKVLN